MSVDEAATTLPGGMARLAEDPTGFGLFNPTDLPAPAPATPPVPVPATDSLAGRHTHHQPASTLDHAGVGIAEVDAEGRLLRVNAHLCDLMGDGPEALIGRSIFDESNAEDVEKDRALFQRQRAGDLDRYTVEKRIRRQDGSYFWASVNSSSVLDPAGRFLYAVRVQHDVTDRKQAETALARRMEEQKALFGFTEAIQHARSLEQVHAAALDAIQLALRCERCSVLLQSAGVMRFVAWRGLSDGYRHAVEGHSPWRPDDPNPQAMVIPNVERADLAEDLKRTIRAEGIAAVAFIPLLQNGRLLGKFMAYYDTPHDFAVEEIEVALALARQLGFGLERMQAERAAQHLAAIVESSEDAIVSKSLEGVILSWNGGAERIFGYTAAEAIGRPIHMLIPEDRQNEEPQILARIRQGERVDHFDTVRQRKDGRRIDISLSISPIRDEWGRTMGASKIARDISERKQAETQQRVLLNELNHRVKNNMQMLQSLLANSARNAQHPEAKEILAEASDRLSAMAAAQRVLYGTIDATRFDAHEFLNAVCKTAQHGFPDRIKIRCSADIGPLPNDTAMPLALIVNELLTNAVKHGMKGREEGTIQVALDRDGAAFVLSVGDEGPGFDLETVVRHASGLQLVQGLARQLRGRFEVHRKPTRCMLHFG